MSFSQAKRKKGVTLGKKQLNITNLTEGRRQSSRKEGGVWWGKLTDMKVLRNEGKNQIPWGRKRAAEGGARVGPYPREKVLTTNSSIAVKEGVRKKKRFNKTFVQKNRKDTC